MSYCNHCGRLIEDHSKYCPMCGGAQINVNCTVKPYVPEVKDRGGFLWGLLGFVLPIPGLIIYLLFRDTKPKTSKSIIKGVLINFAIATIWVVFFFLLMVGEIFLSM